MSAFTLSDLARIVTERARSPSSESYTARLLEGGAPRTAKKFGEEAVEAVIAATTGDRASLVAESADVLYHLLVMLHGADVSLDEVFAELERRTGRSGLEEKASRTR